MKLQFTLTGEMEIDDCSFGGGITAKGMQRVIEAELQELVKKTEHGEVVEDSLKITSTISQSD